MFDLALLVVDILTLATTQSGQVIGSALNKMHPSFIGVWNPQTIPF